MPTDTQIIDGGKLWQHVLDGKSVWGVTGPMYDDVGMPCVVVTGRTAQETREAFELLDNRNRIFPGCVRDA